MNVSIKPSKNVCVFMKNNIITFNHCTLLDEAGMLHPNQSLVIENGILTRITSDVLEGIDCSGLVISPGFVNLHTHAAMNIFKGIAEDVSIDAWFNEEIWPYESKMEEQDVYLGTRLAMAEMMKNGVTAYADHYFSPNAILRAAEEMGIKTDLAITLFGFAPNYQDDLKQAIELIRQNKNERVHLRLGPHSPYTCSPEVLKEIAGHAKVLGCGLHIHVSETQSQVDESIQNYGKKPLEIVYESACLDVPCIIGHGLYITPEEHPLLQKDTMISLSPKTYLKLAMGLGHMPDLIDDEHYAIGTDGAASSNSLNPLEQARLLGLVLKDVYQDARKAKLEQLWKLLMKGHEALPFNSGKLKEGYSADLIFWDLNQVHTMPVYNPLASILYSANETNIKAVMINGEWVKKDYQLLLDETLLIQEVNAQVQDLLKRGKGKAKVHF